MADQERKVYSFKSVGNTDRERRERFRNNNADLPIGFRTPLTLSSTHADLFEMHTDIKSQIRDNFRNLLASNHGDRLMVYDFGANLLPLAFELGAESIDLEAQRRISETTRKFMPYVSLDTFEPFRENSLDGGLARIGIRVTYSVPSLQFFNQAVEAIVFAAG